MKKKSIIIFGVLILMLGLVSVNAAGTAPSSYNGDARALLEMLWTKLDEAIVSNYNVSMLLRYHDHEGSVGDGSFITRGLPIGTSGIENGAVTSAKLSTAAKTRIVTAQVGNLAAGSGLVDEKPIFVAPTNGTITRVTFTTSNNVTQSDINFTQLMLARWRAGVRDAVATAVAHTQTTGSSFAPMVAVDAMINQVDGRYPQQNDVYTIYKNDVGAGRATDDLLITIEYTISE